MKLLVDTHLLLWLVGESFRLSRRMRKLLDDPANILFFSAISLWEISIKRGLNKPGFNYEVGAVRSGLLQHGWHELSLDGRQISSLSALPMIHRDPFDRVLIAQALGEGLTLLTADKTVAKYPGRILLV